MPSGINAAAVGVRSPMIPAHLLISHPGTVLSDRYSPRVHGVQNQNLVCICDSQSIYSVSTITVQVNRTHTFRGFDDKVTVIHGALGRAVPSHQTEASVRSSMGQQQRDGGQCWGLYPDKVIEEILLKMYPFCIRRSMRTAPLTLQSVKPTSAWGEQIKMYHILLITLWQGRNVQCNVPYIAKAVSQASGEKQDEVRCLCNHSDV